MLLWLLIASSLAFPLTLFRWRNAENNFFFGKIYGLIARAIMGIQVQVEGTENLQVRPGTFVVNHQSGLDLATLSAVYPRGAVIIGKKEIRFIPVFGLMFEAFGNVLINRQDRSSALSDLKRAVLEMKKKNLSAWIFPEGTRNTNGEGLLPFKKGAFYMAIESGSPVVPIICSRLERLVNFRKRYAHSGTLVVRVLPPISTLGMSVKDVDLLLTQTREKMMSVLPELNARAEKIDS